MLLPEKEIQQPRFGCRGFVVHFLKMVAEAFVRGCDGLGRVDWRMAKNSQERNINVGNRRE